MPFTLTEYAYHFLREKIMTGELGPPGTRISDLDLSKLIGISRTPVREAINQLASEGLLDRRPRLGVFIKLPDGKELEELYDLRVLLESHAAERAAEDHGKVIREGAGQAHQAMGHVIEDFRESGDSILEGELAIRWFTAESNFHIHILEGARNGQIMKIASELRLMTQILGRRRSDHTLKALVRIHAEHTRILESILNGDARRARTLMAQHIQRGKQQVKQLFESLAHGSAASLPDEDSKPGDWPEALRQAIYRNERARLGQGE